MMIHSKQNIRIYVYIGVFTISLRCTDVNNTKLLEKLAEIWKLIKETDE